MLGLLSASDVLLPVLTDGEHPLMAVALVASVIGLASLALIVSAWRGARRAVVPLVVLRVLSALTAVPAFFTPDVPTAGIVAAAAVMALTIVGIALMLPALRQSSVAGAR